MTTTAVGWPAVLPQTRSPGPPRRADGRWSWSATLVVSTVTTATALVSLVLVSPWPTGVAAWQLLAPPVALGLSMVLTRIRVELAVAVLSISLLTLFRPTYEAMSAVGVWQAVGSFALYFGICWVTCSLGRQVPVRWSAPWMVGYAAAVVVGLAFDAPITMLGIGWWLVGASFRHSAELTARLRERADELADEQDRFSDEAVRLERARIARELHDVVAHCMTVIVIQARAGRQLADVDPAAADEALDAILVTAREAEGDLDALLGVMDPTTHPLTRDLLDTLVRRAAAGGADVSLELRGDPSTLDAADRAVAYRVVQEALTNALRHAPGAAVRVEVDCVAGLTVRVSNGPGVESTPATVGSGQGLAGIAERVAGLGGTATWGHTSDGGWQLSVTLP